MTLTLNAQMEGGVFTPQHLAALKTDEDRMGLTQVVQMGLRVYEIERRN